MADHYANYRNLLASALEITPWDKVAIFSEALLESWKTKRTVYICGNGGSAANAIHIANDFLYGVANNIPGQGIRVEALPSNVALITCLANDIGYDEIFAEQLRVKGDGEDMLVALSGSGNSENIIRALEVGNEMGMKTVAILGFTGGTCVSLANIPIHVPVEDMQISEDIQLIICHMCMQWLCKATQPVD